MEIGAIFWLVLLVVLLVVEAETMGLTTIWFAGGALVSFIATLCGVNVVGQRVIFIIVSMFLLIFTRPIAKKYVNNKTVKTNIDDLIGKKAVVTMAIDNLAEVGEAHLKGNTWMARAIDDGVKIESGAVVIVEEIRGVKLIVKPENIMPQVP